MPSTAVLAVPLLGLEPLVAHAILKCVASGHLSFKNTAKQSVGITSDPTPGQSTTLDLTASSCLL